jgi:hypothetical protein
MAVYFVRPDGDNGNDGLGYLSGTGAGHAWATWAKATSTVAAGDTVYFSPNSTFYELVVLATSGNSSNIIKWIGDKEAKYFLDMKPGPVRLTGCNSITGIGTATTSIINCNSKGYNNFYNLVIDGQASAGTYRGIIGVAALTNIAYDCISSSTYSGFYYMTTVRCFGLGGVYGFENCNCENSIGLGGFSSGIATKCIAIGNRHGFINVISTNCSALNCYNGFIASLAVNINNCNTFNCFYGFTGNIITILKKCKSINCYTGFNGVTTNLNITDCTYSQCNIISAGLITGTATSSKYEGYNDISKILKLAEVLKFNIFENDWSTDIHDLTVSGTISPSTANNDYVNIGTYNSQSLYQSIYKDYLIFNSTTANPSNWIIEATGSITPNEIVSDYAYCSTVTGSYTVTGSWSGSIVTSTYTPIVFTEDYDILGQPRRMGNGKLDCGAFEYSNVSMEWNTYKTTTPAIKISYAGQKRLTITVNSGSVKTISCWTYFDLNSGSLKPQLIISSSEDVVSSSIVTATGAENTWEYLTTTVTPYASGLINVTLYNRETGSLAYGIFSDFKL